MGDAEHRSTEAGWGDLSPGEMDMVSASIRRATARTLRANTTPHERTLWRALREFPIEGSHFRRQAPIGRYVADFFCPAKRLIIELDGGHHNEEQVAERDRERQLWLEQQGYRVIRFWNSDITSDLNAAMERIYVEVYGAREAEVERLKHRRYSRKQHPTPPLRGDPPLPGEGKNELSS